MKHPVPAQGERRKSSWCQAVQGLKTGYLRVSLRLYGSVGVADLTPEVI